MLHIEHTSRAGTRARGTEPGDGAAAILKEQGWRWGTSLGAWYVPRSRDQAPRRALIDATAAALRAAGHEVSLSIDATPRDGAAIEADRREAEAARSERLTTRAAAQRAQADRHAAVAAALGGGMGEPTIGGTVTSRRGEIIADRAAQHQGASIDHERAGRGAAEAAERARRAAGERNGAVVVAERIERLAAEERCLVAALGKYDERVAGGADPQPAWRLNMGERLVHVQANLEHWRAIRAAQIAAGTVVVHSPDTVTAGDQVLIAQRWCTVVRANTASVTVQFDGGWRSYRVAWHRVTGHQAQQQSTSDAALIGTND